MSTKKYASLTTLQKFLDNLKTNFAAITHSHKLSDITDYTIDNALSSTSTNSVQNKVINAEFDAIATAMNALEQSVDEKASSSHTHTVANITDLTVNAAELNYTKGVTSNIQTQLDSKVGTSDVITDDEIDEICSFTMASYLDSISAEGVSF